MAYRFEALSPEGLRGDGRRIHEQRFLNLSVGRILQNTLVTGSSEVRLGQTVVNCTVSGPHESIKQRSSPFISDRITLQAKIYIAPFSNQNDRKVQGHNERRALELSSIIEQTFTALIEPSWMPRSRIDIGLEVLQQDGGILATLINATTLALIDAGIPMLDYACASRVAFFSDKVILDPTHLEEVEMPCMTVVTSGVSKTILTIRVDDRIQFHLLNQGLELALSHCAHIRFCLNNAIKEASNTTKNHMNRTSIKD